METSDTKYGMPSERKELGQIYSAGLRKTGCLTDMSFSTGELTKNPGHLKLKLQRERTIFAIGAHETSE